VDVQRQQLDAAALALELDDGVAVAASPGADRAEAAARSAAEALELDLREGAAGEVVALGLDLVEGLTETRDDPRRSASSAALGGRGRSPLSPRSLAGRAWATTVAVAATTTAMEMALAKRTVAGDSSRHVPGFPCSRSPQSVAFRLDRGWPTHSRRRNARASATDRAAAAGISAFLVQPGTP
jgi:hypothetical protein